jgi:SNF2 family DNA or RNA helicase
MFGLAPGFFKRVIMTGTPIANRPYDIWSLIWFLDQGRSLASTFEDFRTDFDLSNALATDAQKEAGFRSRLGGLYSKIESFTVRETKSSVDISLPQKEIHTVLTDFEPRQKEMYFEIRDDLRTTIRRDGRELVDNAEDTNGWSANTQNMDRSAARGSLHRLVRPFRVR